jgi:predicted transcriptional regulator
MGLTNTTRYTEAQNTLAQWAKALAHPARIAIIEYLLRQNSCINSNLVQELGLAQATVSQHLRELKEAGLIHGTIEGTSINYCINPVQWQAVDKAFQSFFANYRSDTSSCC